MRRSVLTAVVVVGFASTALAQDFHDRALLEGSVSYTRAASGDGWDLTATPFVSIAASVGVQVDMDTDVSVFLNGVWMGTQTLAFTTTGTGTGGGGGGGGGSDPCSPISQSDCGFYTCSIDTGTIPMGGLCWYNTGACRCHVIPPWNSPLGTGGFTLSNLQLATGDVISVELTPTPGSTFDSELANNTFSTTVTICNADFNVDGGVDDLDIGSFFDAFQNGFTGADIDGSGGIDDLDIIFFFIEFESGC